MPNQRTVARAGLALAAIVAFSFAVHAGRAVRTTTVILVRHAEKAAEPREDPPLSDAGRTRAEALARAVSPTGVTAIGSGSGENSTGLGLEIDAACFGGAEAHPAASTPATTASASGLCTRRR